MNKTLSDKKWLLALVFTISLFGLANCGGGGDDSATGGDQANNDGVAGENGGGDGENGGGDGGGGAGGNCAIGDKVRIECDNTPGNPNAGLFRIVTIGNGICEGNDSPRERDLLRNDNEDFNEDGALDCTNEENQVCGDPDFTDNGTTDPDCPEYIEM